MEVLRHPNRAVRFCFLGLLLLGALSLFSYVFSINSPRGLQRFWGDFEITQNYWAVWTNRTTGFQWAWPTRTNQRQPALPSVIPTPNPDLESDFNTTAYANSYHFTYPRNYRFIVDEPGVCETKSPFLVLMVPVAPHNLAARDAIRRMWGNETLVRGQRVLTLFLLGLPGGSDAEQQLENVRQESRTHRDLIQSNFMDTYLNLTIKTMVIMDWLATRCSDASYAMKIDSDMFLNVQNLVAMLQTSGVPQENYLTGMLMWDRPVVRDPASKWYVPEEMYPDSTYPTYTLGMGYVFSNDLPEKLVEVSKDVQPFSIEDAYVGACLKKLGLGPTSPPDPSRWKAYLNAYDRCEFSSVITYILGGSNQLVEYWTDLHRPEPPCNSTLN